MDNIKQWVGKRIREVRNKAGLTQFQLAEKAGLNLSWLGQIERGQRTATIITIEKICRALNVSLGEFFNEKKYLPQEDDLLSRELIGLLKGKTKKDIRLIVDVAKRIFQPEQPIKKPGRN